jgi:hypothetical protein
MARNGLKPAKFSTSPLYIAVHFSDASHPWSSAYWLAQSYYAVGVLLGESLAKTLK